MEIINTIDAKHPRVSEKYQLVPTKMIAQKFFDLGFVVDEYKSVRVRDNSRQGYQKHFVRLSHPTMLTTQHSDVKLQLLVTNSHDGSSSFSIKLGIFRLVCANGLVVGSVFENIKLRHSGNILNEIEPAIERMTAQVRKLDEALERMKDRQMSDAEIERFYNEAVKVRYGEKTQTNDVIIQARRPEDKENNLFTVYNRVQEALIRGSQARGANGRLRQRRAIRSIDKDVTINEKLFNLAYSFIEEAQAA